MQGKRIRQARLAAGLTLQELSSRLAEAGIELTRAALSKYECDKSLPSAHVILAMASELHVEPSYFFSPSSVEIDWLAFRKRASLTRGRQDQLKALAAERVERQVELHRLLTPEQTPRFPRSDRVSQPSDAEDLAVKIRKLWRLGDGPLDSVAHSIEDHGGIVVDLETADSEFDGLSGWADDRYPVIITSKTRSVDRKRYNLCHELGHLAMTVDGQATEKLRESLAHRFAGAFLVPESAAKRELGSVRRHLGLAELIILKRKWGLSVQAWARRALDLTIISHAHYVGIYKQISSKGWRSTEPAPLENDETPNRMKQLLARAVAEGVLHEHEAAEYPEWDAVTREVLEENTTRKTALDLLMSSETERDQALSEAAEALYDSYAAGSELRSFEAGEVLERHERAPEAKPH
jgi:Zn-dependent peptidase ImmA (M78 family)/transcriptional regulator with XRE-family HTH domain